MMMMVVVVGASADSEVQASVSMPYVCVQEFLLGILI